jgi:opacity protein-like surface antigen
MKKFLLAAAALAAVGCAAAPAAAAVRVGTLTCHEASGWGMILGSTRRLHCDYQGVDHQERYVGDLSKVGVDIGYQGPAQIVWAVFAPTDRMGPGALSGHYGGVTANAAVGVGLGANALVGGSDRTITLQPLSVEGATGLDVAAGIGGMSLHFRRGD